MTQTEAVPHDAGVQNRFYLAARNAKTGHFRQQNRARSRRFFIPGNEHYIPEYEYAILAVDE